LLKGKIQTKMEFQITHYTPGSKPDVILPEIKMLDLLGEAGVRKMVSDHYDLLAKSTIAHLFPDNQHELDKAKKNSSDFFIQILGGPMYFTANRGKPMLFKRHIPHKITPEAREIWLNCYREVLFGIHLPDDVKQSFWNYLDVFSVWMVNTPSAAPNNNPTPENQKIV